MQSKQWMGLMVLGLATATPAFAAGQADAKGFVEDSSLNVLLRVNADLKLIRLSGSCRFKTDTPLSH